jgi:redox-sensitive bicupin YhaK (pirin superfamily)
VDQVARNQAFAAASVVVMLFFFYSVGSGIEHAEGGGCGGTLEGFQIWVNVPSARKMDEPRYGTEPPAAIPLLHVPGGEARVLAGSCGGAVGPFKTVTAVEIVDYSLAATGVVQHHVASELDNALVFCYRGSGSVCGAAVKENSITLLKADDQENRSISLQSGRSVSGSSKQRC